MKFNIRSYLSFSFLLENFCLTCVVMFAIFLYLKRVIHPDISFDTINYHFFLGKSGLENFPESFQKAEFYPLGIHSFNPLPDVFSALCYEILGYRFGTILSLLSYLGILFLCVSIIKCCCKSIASPIVTLMLGPVLVVNEGLFQISTYMTDNFLSFFSVLALFCVIKIDFCNRNLKFLVNFFIFWISIGILATKLTCLIYAVPLVLTFLYRFCGAMMDAQNAKMKVRFAFFLVSGIALCLVIPGYHWLSVYMETGNPVFPYYNLIFKSEYYPRENWDFSFGPKTFLERIIYPFVALYNPARLGEVKDFFPDVKLIVLFFVSFCSYAYCAVNKIKFSINENVLLLNVFFSFIIWQFLFGYSRYAIALEFMLGVAVVVISKKIYFSSFSKTRTYFPLVICVLLLVQSAFVILFNAKYDISWRRSPESLSAWGANFFSLAMFEKYTMCSTDLMVQLRNVDLVLQCVNPSSGYFKTFLDLKDKPLLNYETENNIKLCNNNYYISERNKRADIYSNLKNKNNITFAMIVNNTNKGLNNLHRAMNAVNIANKNSLQIQIEREVVVDNFVGDHAQQLLVYIGRLRAKSPEM